MVFLYFLSYSGYFSGLEFLQDLWYSFKQLLHLLLNPLLESLRFPNSQSSFSIPHFEKQYNCTVAKVAWPFGVAAGVRGLNNLGHGWRLDTIPTYTIHWEGQVYTNIVSPSQFCKTFNIRPNRFRDYLKGKLKNARKYHIEINHP